MNTFDATKTSHRNRYDSDVPPNLLEFMLKSWKLKRENPSGALPNAGNFRQRRKRLSKQFAGELLVIPSGHLKVRVNDTYYAFRPGTDFYYLTGNLEPDCVLVLRPGGFDSEDHEALLFVEPNPGKTDATFFTDRIKGELWEGPRLGVRGSEARLPAAARTRGGPDGGTRGAQCALARAARSVRQHGEIARSRQQSTT